MPSFGREHLAIPGPSTMPDRVLRAMHRASPNIYSGELPDMMPGIRRDLKAVARTEGDVAIYIGNGHAAWEAALANTCAPGGRVLVPATGLFGHGWGEMARRAGAEATVLEFGKRTPVDPARIEEALRADPSIRSVLLVQTDTSTSVLSDVRAVRAAMDAARSDALLQVDAIACLGVDRLEMDEWGADVVVTGSQKGLMTPPGLCFVFFGPRAVRAREGLDRVSLYWDWVPRTAPGAFWQNFCGTAPTHHLYGLREALDILVHEEGVEEAWARHDRLARAVWSACEAWSAGGGPTLNVADPDHRSRATTTCALDGAERLRAWCEERAGVTLGIGLGMQVEGAQQRSSPDHFRIGHMGHLNAQMILGTLGAIDAGLKALRMPHGPGALEGASAALAT
ncbi:alanine-glyoxylate transaminase/serine-glyoxylate transaminase/serine-pyruvate transaminase [Hasllibacter halocynthiae]|uniref:Alanine-glyoxylate transaminase/serine-glyoxylate transaminase/serine-pyruvate transaminase n=1 Tax=Hasllibacter halocynthiae TaxID=595589 RepID=A0A2T0X671_9RHOB|nr:aminotransferase class V-fold PLP-dependent enzyme [Hasllibacter halocynthiae]PRY94452.1 alanine-glyoxylate transaminase/serine-glyoxylate transaminase/serine-pyruvate transaminase [Hasllibacter halocynthiae]